MKPQLHSLLVSSDSSFLYKNLDCAYFPNPWHFHKEYELVLINESSGTRFIGDNVCQFQGGDLSLIGSNIPHLYRNNQDYYNADSELQARSTFIHFTKQSLGEHFFHIPEMKFVNRLLNKCPLALDIHGKTKKNVTTILLKMRRQSPDERLMSLLEILMMLSHSRDLKPILSSNYTTNLSGDIDKINTVFEFIIKNFNENIYVEEIASKLYMSVASFSRYFKLHTRKTFTDYVTEIRIGHACRLLMENNKSISEISYESGFDNLSNFYRHFKRIMGIIPKEYRNRFISMEIA
jgi:AraC-like DNA-binding protein